jgi:hypothetical protein
MAKVYALPLSGKIAYRQNHESGVTVIMVQPQTRAATAVYRAHPSLAWTVMVDNQQVRRTYTLRDALRTLDLAHVEARECGA